MGRIAREAQYSSHYLHIAKKVVVNNGLGELTVGMIVGLTKTTATIQYGKNNGKTKKFSTRGAVYQFDRYGYKSEGYSRHNSHQVAFDVIASHGKTPEEYISERA
jgi:hypothetical protein